VLVDGTPIYKPFHIIGFYSAFPSELVASADFYAGGLGAEYRGALSSVLDVNLRPGNLRRFEGGGTGSLRWQFSTGRPFTQAYGKDSYLEIIGARDQPIEDAGIPRVLYSRTYGARLPSYHRLDASFERPFELRNRTNLTVEIGAINAYDRSNVFYVDLFTNDRVDQLPVIPYVGLELSFE